jgi:hypothetical protein
MRSTFLGRAALASTLIFAIGACGDSGTTGPDFDDEATMEETEDVAYDAVEIAVDVVDQLNFDGPNIALSATKAQASLRAIYGPQMGASRLPAGIVMPGVTFSAAGELRLSAAPGCTTSSYGNDGDPWDWWDANENGIADDWGIDYTCVMKDSSDLENILTQTQKLKITIKENTASLFGYHVTQAYSTTYRYQNGDGFGGGFTGNETLDIRAGSATHHQEFESKEWGDEESDHEEWVTGSESNVTFDPDGTISTEAALPDGEFELAGRRYFASTGGLSLSFTLETTDPLAYDAVCWDDNINPPFTDGTLVGRLNGRSSSATFTIDFNGCDDFTIDTDHTSDEPVVVTKRPPLEERIALWRR